MFKKSDVGALLAEARAELARVPHRRRLALRAIEVST
jgi:hypothetical protein